MPPVEAPARMTMPSATPMPRPEKMVQRKISSVSTRPSSSSLKQRQKGGAQHAAGKGVQCELLAQHRPAPHQHGHVEEEEETGDGEPRQPPEGQRDAGGTARDEPGGLQNRATASEYSALPRMIARLFSKVAASDE